MPLCAFPLIIIFQMVNSALFFIVNNANRLPFTIRAGCELFDQILILRVVIHFALQQRVSLYILHRSHDSICYLSLNDFHLLLRRYVKLQYHTPVLNLNRGLLFLSGYVYSHINCQCI